MDGRVGDINWLDCEDCKHYRPNEGGCIPLDEQGESILHVDMNLEVVTCIEYEKGE